MNPRCATEVVEGELHASGSSPSFGGPCFACILLEVVWGPKIFPLGLQNRRPVRSSRHVLIERKAKSNAGGLVVLLID
jgi:hypothetical protein